MLRARFYRTVMIAAICCIAGALPVHADVSENITAAEKMMRSGAHVKAIEIVNAALESTDISPQLAGKALLIRAQSHEKLGKVAYALADYDRAIWMEGLSAADKKAAEEGRIRVESSLGLKEETPVKSARIDTEDSDQQHVSTPPPVAKPVKSQQQAVVASQPAPQPKQAAPQQQTTTVNASVVQPKPRPKPKEEEGGISGFFDNLFGSSESETPQTKQPPRQAQPKPSPKPKQEEEGVSGFVSNLFGSESENQSSQRKAVAAAHPKRATPPAVQQTRSVNPPPSTPVTTGSVGTGKFAIQFAALYEEDKAIAEVNRIEKKFGVELNGRSPSMLIVPTKDGGTLYKIVAGPFPKEEGVATCENLKLKKINCMVITHKQ